MQNEFGTFPAASSGWGSARDRGPTTPTLAAGVGSTPFYLWQNGLFGEGEGEIRAKQGSTEGVKDLVLWRVPDLAVATFAQHAQ